MNLIIIKLVVAVFWAVIAGLLAKRKNRNVFGWGIAGALSWPIALIILAFMPYLCPKCKQTISNQEAKIGNCPNCNAPKKSSSEIKAEIDHGATEAQEPEFSFVAKDNFSLFEYACKYLDCKLYQGVRLPAIILDAKEEFDTEQSVIIQDDGSQLAVVKVADSDGGFVVPAQTTGRGSVGLKPGDLVAWQAMEHMPDMGNEAGDYRFGWVGFIIGTLKLELTNKELQIDKEL